MRYWPGQEGWDMQAGPVRYITRASLGPWWRSGGGGGASEHTYAGAHARPLLLAVLNCVVRCSCPSTQNRCYQSDYFLVP